MFGGVPVLVGALMRQEAVPLVVHAALLPAYHADKSMTEGFHYYHFIFLLLCSLLYYLVLIPTKAKSEGG